jgi:hypothetical protein
MPSSIIKVCHTCGTCEVKRVFKVRGALGRKGLVGMRQLILIMGLAWMEVCILAQRATTLSKRFSVFILITTHVLNTFICDEKLLVLLTLSYTPL